MNDVLLINCPRGYNTIVKNYFSYTQYHLWRTNRNAYRDRYFYGKPSFETAETRFGKSISDLMEKEGIEGIPKYSHPEYEIKVDVGDGLTLLGRLDSFDPEKKAFLEYKTGHVLKTGQHTWNAQKVLEHDQLPFYSMLIELQFGKVQDECKLIHLETEFYFKEMEWNGHTLLSTTRSLRLTGKHSIFDRSITDGERKIILQDVKDAWREIKEDYQQLHGKPWAPFVQEKSPQQEVLQGNAG